MLELAHGIRVLKDSHLHREAVDLRAQRCDFVERCHTYPSRKCLRRAIAAVSTDPGGIETLKGIPWQALNPAAAAPRTRAAKRKPRRPTLPATASPTSASQPKRPSRLLSC